MIFGFYSLLLDFARYLGCYSSKGSLTPWLLFIGVGRDDACSGLCQYRWDFRVDYRTFPLSQGGNSLLVLTIALVLICAKIVKLIREYENQPLENL